MVPVEEGATTIRELQWLRAVRLDDGRVEIGVRLALGASPRQAVATLIRATLPQILVSMCSGVILWSLYFSIGFWAFARGNQGGTLGILLTVGLPVLTMLFGAAHLGWATALTPPGSVYFPMAHGVGVGWIVGPLLGGIVTLLLARFGLRTCDQALRRWYDANHGLKTAS